MSGIIMSQFSTLAPILVLALIDVNFTLGFKMLNDTLKETQFIARIADQISKGNYDVIMPPAKKDNRYKLIETFNIMTYRLKQHELHLRHKMYQTTLLKEISERITA